MKSGKLCPACGAEMETTRYDDGQRLWCGSVHCMDKICREGQNYEPKFGQDVNWAFDQLKVRHERNSTPKCLQCNVTMEYEDDRDEEGTLTQAPWWHCPSCGANQTISSRQEQPQPKE